MNAEVFTEMWRESSDTSINAELFSSAQCELPRPPQRSPRQALARETKRAVLKNLQPSAARLLARIHMVLGPDRVPDRGSGPSSRPGLQSTKREARTANREPLPY